MLVQELDRVFHGDDVVGAGAVGQVDDAGLDGDVEHTAGNTNTIEDAIVPFLIANDAKLVGGKVVGDPTEGALLVLGHKAKLDVEGTQATYPRLATLPFDPTYKLMAVFEKRLLTGCFP